MKYTPKKHQVLGTQHLLDHASAGLFMDMGLGKSVMTLTALEWWFGTFEVNKPLIIGPKRVVSHTWPSEIRKWDHTNHLRISIITGTEKQRITALQACSDIFAVSRDNIAWLVDYCKRVLKKWPFDCIIIDELSNFKTPSSQRFKALRKILPYTTRVVGLTGTPAPNKLLNLWGQLYLLDQGQRLGETYTKFRDEYFTPGARNGHIIFNYEPRPGSEQRIYDKIKDICISMKTSDADIDLPPRYDIYEEITLEDHERYQKFKETEILTLAGDYELSPVNAAVLYNKLLQYCNGAVYKPDRSYEVVDNSKLDALVESVDELQGNPVLIGYQFQSDYERMLKQMPSLIKIDSDEKIDQFNRGEITIACAQVQSLAYGLNLQESCHHLFHFGVGWDLEIYQQFMKRVHRQGVKHPVINKHFVAENSVEQLVIDRLFKKNVTQESLMTALNKYISK